MRRRNVEDDDQRPGWFWKFLRGVLIALVVSAGVAAVLSIYVLPPPAPPPPEVAEVPAGPQMIGGIEVSTEPAYTGAAGSDEATSETGTPGLAAVEPGRLEPVELSGPALTVNSAPFVATPGMPLVAVILTDAAANPVLHELLFSVDLPLTVGVIAGGGGDRETAAAARAVGFEVVAELPVVAQGASGGAALEYGMAESDVASRTLTLMQRLPMAVAATRTLDAWLPPDPQVLRGMLGALTPLGFGYVDHGVAPGASSSAVTSGLDAFIGVSRFSIRAGTSAAEIITVLDEAAANAVSQGGAVVFAAPDEQMILALQLWGDAGAGNLAQLAPLSAVIRSQNGG